MTKFVTHRQCLNKCLDGRWDWAAPVWLTKVGMFANCVIKSPENSLFDTEEKARANMITILTKLGIVKPQPKKKKK